MGRPYDLSIERGSSRLLRTFHAPSRLHTTTRNEWTRFSFGRENKVAVCQSGAIRSCAHNNSIFTLSIEHTFRFLQCSVCRPPKIILIVAFHRNVRRNQTIRNSEKCNESAEWTWWIIVYHSTLSLIIIVNVWRDNWLLLLIFLDCINSCSNNIWFLYFISFKYCMRFLI